MKLVNKGESVEMVENEPRLLEEQIAYYRARAAEYDQWFYRQGRYDHGPELNRRWAEEASEVERALEEFDPKGSVLELACGTGIWTERLARHAGALMAVDASPEMLAINRQKLGTTAVRYIQANLFDWKPEAQYDAVFFGFWLSHVPPERFASFWDMVRSCLAPGGRVFFVDSLFDPSSTARDQALKDENATTMRRRLNEGQEYTIYKIYYRPEQLAGKLVSLDWRATVRATANYFLYGEAA